MPIRFLHCPVLVQWHFPALRDGAALGQNAAMHKDAPDVPPTPEPGAAAGTDAFVPPPGSRASLGVWLTAMVLAAVAVALLISALLIENFARAHAERRAIESLRQVAMDFRDALDRGMAQQFKEVRVLAQLEPFRRVDDPEAMRRALDQVQVGFDHFAWLGVTDARGKVLAAAGGLLDGVDVSKRPWWQGSKNGQPFVGDVHAALLLEKLLPRRNEPWRFVDFAVPLLDDRGQLRGVFGVHLSWGWARQIKSELIDATMASHQADALVLGKDGAVILGPSELEGKTMTLGAETGHGLRHHEVDGADYYAVSVPSQGYGPYPGLGWTVLVRQPVAVALADYYQLRRQIVWSAVLLLAAAVPLSWWLARRMSRPLNELAEAIAQRRHLSEDALPTLRGYREAALLSHALNDLAHRQAEQDRALAQLNASLELRVEARTLELHDAMLQQESSERRLRTIADNLPVLISYIDAQERLRFLNDTFRSWMGMAPDEALGRPLLDVIGPVLHAQRQPYLKAALAGVRQRFETRSETNGIARDMLAEYVPDIRPDGSVAGVYTLATDITAFKQVERELDQLSRIDPLTGLPNRRQFESRLSEALARARRNRRTLALMFLDLDHFKQVNDQLGHAAGDAVLKTFAQRVRGALRETDQLCRLAGDEFVLILENLNGPDEAALVAQKVLDAVAPPLTLQGQELRLSTSIGVACHDGGQESDAALLGRADDALYAAKADGRGRWRMAAGSEV